MLSVGVAQELPRATPGDACLSADKLDKITTLVHTSVDANQTAGAVVLMARRGKVICVKAVGTMDVQTGKPKNQTVYHGPVPLWMPGRFL